VGLPIGGGSVDERHPGGAEPEREGGEVKAAGDEARVEVRLAVAAVVELVEVCGGHEDERGIARQLLPVGDPEELRPQVAGANGSIERGIPVEAGLEALDGVDGDEVRQRAAVHRGLRATTRRPRG
jgi:hypothetical protein